MRTFPAQVHIKGQAQYGLGQAQYRLGLIRLRQPGFVWDFAVAIGLRRDKLGLIRLRQPGFVWDFAVASRLRRDKLGLIGFVLVRVEGGFIFCNPLSNSTLGSYQLFRNWVCFA